MRWAGWTPEHLELLGQWAQRAVDAARTAGASYADARFTRTVQHSYSFSDGYLFEAVEVVGVGIRALMHGYWGFTGCPLWVGDPAGADTVIQLAQEAVAQAQVNAHGAPRTVELGSMSAVTGIWTTPVQIDPFSIPIEEKQDTIRFWSDLASRYGVAVSGPSWLRFRRQERVAATSEGTCIHQTCYESGGAITMKQLTSEVKLPIRGIDKAGKGWELFLEANIPEQMAAMPEQLAARAELERTAQPRRIGRYTLVCDGATMASLLEQTLGIATQLDRALGYEANAGGTSFLDDPLGMVGHFQVASPLVSVTANRSAPAQLATVKWDDEGVVPEDFTLIKDGVLVDYQTTREQAAWLGPYYQKVGKPVRSHGCAAAQEATYITLQHMPNLSLIPSPSVIRLEDLVADVQEGLLLEGCAVEQADFQARTGLISVAGLGGAMREIKNGRLGRMVAGGQIMFDALDLWRSVRAVGGEATVGGVIPADRLFDGLYLVCVKGGDYGARVAPQLFKGQPGQYADHSVRGIAATITNQPLIDARRKA